VFGCDLLYIPSFGLIYILGSPTVHIFAWIADLAAGKFNFFKFPNPRFHPIYLKWTRGREARFYLNESQYFIFSTLLLFMFFFFFPKMTRGWKEKETFVRESLSVVADLEARTLGDILLILCKQKGSPYRNAIAHNRVSKGYTHTHTQSMCV
jgi:hypothetical protein